MSSRNFRDSNKNSKKVNIHKSWDINYWCEELNLRAEELKEIVKKVGPEIHRIKLHLLQKTLLNI